MRAERSVNKRVAEFSTTDGHGLTQMGGGFSTEGNDANEGEGGSVASSLFEDENEEEDESLGQRARRREVSGRAAVARERRSAASRWLLLLVCSLEPLLSDMMFFIVF